MAKTLEELKAAGPQIGDTFHDPLSDTETCIQSIENGRAFLSVITYPLQDLVPEQRGKNAVWTATDNTRRQIHGIMTPREAFADEMEIGRHP